MDERFDDEQATQSEMRGEEPATESTPPPSQSGGPPPIVDEDDDFGSDEQPDASRPADDPAPQVSESRLPAAVPAADTGDRSQMLAGTRDRLLEVLSATDRAAEGILDAARAEAEEAVRAARIEADDHVRSTHRRVEELTRDRMERLSAVTEDLLGQAESVRQQVETLRRALDGTTNSLAGELGLSSAGAIESEAVAEPPQLAEPPTLPEPPTQPKPLEQASPEDVGPPVDAPPPTYAPPDDQPFEQAPPEPEPEPQQKRSVFSRLRRGSKSEEASKTPIDSNAIEILIMQMLAGGADRTEIEHRLRTEFQIEDPSALLNAVGPFAARR